MDKLESDVAREARQRSLETPAIVRKPKRYYASRAERRNAWREQARIESRTIGRQLPPWRGMN